MYFGLFQLVERAQALNCANLGSDSGSVTSRVFLVDKLIDPSTPKFPPLQKEYS